MLYVGYVSFLPSTLHLHKQNHYSFFGSYEYVHTNIHMYRYVQSSCYHRSPTAVIATNFPSSPLHKCLLDYYFSFYSYFDFILFSFDFLLYLLFCNHSGLPNMLSSLYWEKKLLQTVRQSHLTKYVSVLFACHWLTPNDNLYIHTHSEKLWVYLCAILFCHFVFIAHNSIYHNRPCNRYLSLLFD